MNIAFQALLFLLLLLPGFIFLSAYNGKLTKDSHIPLNFPSFSARGVLALVAAAGLHLVWVALSNLLGRVGGWEVALDQVAYLLMGNYANGTASERSIRSMTADAPLVALYFLSLYAFALFAGQALSRCVRRLKLDLRLPWLRYANDWHYLFSGEVLQFPETLEAAREVDGAFISATVELGGKPYLYVGVLKDYWLNRDGGLDRLLLSAVWRRDLSADKTGEVIVPFWEDARYYPIDGDYFVLPCAGLKTLNVQYIVLEELDEAVEVDFVPEEAEGSA